MCEKQMAASAGDDLRLAAFAYLAGYSLAPPTPGFQDTPR